MNAATRKVVIGGYGHTLRAARAGRWGCDSCFFCGVAPGAGDVVWATCYSDIICERCSVRDLGK